MVRKRFKRHKVRPTGGEGGEGGILRIPLTPMLGASHGFPCLAMRVYNVDSVAASSSGRRREFTPAQYPEQCFSCWFLPLQVHFCSRCSNLEICYYSSNLLSLAGPWFGVWVSFEEYRIFGIFWEVTCWFAYSVQCLVRHRTHVPTSVYGCFWQDFSDSLSEGGLGF